MPKSTTGLTLTFSTLLAASALMASCAGMEPSKEMTGREPGAASLQDDALTEDDRLRLQQMRDAMIASRQQTPGNGRIDNGTGWDNQPTGSEWTPDEANRAVGNPNEVVTLSNPDTDGAASSNNNASTQYSNANRGQTLEQRISAASAELAATLRERADRNPEQAASALAAIGSLAMIDPAVSSAYLPDGAMMSARLTPDERAFVNAWAEMSRQIPGVLASDAGRGVARVLRDAAARLDDRALSMPKASLCDRVDGFGLYRELQRSDDRYKFIAGRVNQAIVYVELDGFAFVPSTQEGMNGQSIELTQDISLYEAGSRVLAWRLPAQDISDFSRNRRRDFFVVQVIKLPATLTVGSYELKLSVRDRTTQAVAERVIGIDVVADASALRGK